MAILSFQIKYCHWNKTGVSSAEWEQGYKLNKQCNGAMCVFCLRTFCQQTTRCAKIGPKLKNVVEPFFPHRFFPKSFEQHIPNVEDDQIKKLIYLEPRVFLLLKCLLDKIWAVWWGRTSTTLVIGAFFCAAKFEQGSPPPALHEACTYIFCARFARRFLQGLEKVSHHIFALPTKGAS